MMTDLQKDEINIGEEESLKPVLDFLVRFASILKFKHKAIYLLARKFSRIITNMVHFEAYTIKSRNNKASMALPTLRQ